ncbi:hypothetical protein [Xanthomonas euvesicatoria]|uniref:hypothetical protein n=1 Tax=Xanthomonas euvesicatoria TaxID=456327 RepID=UPI003D2F73CD
MSQLSFSSFDSLLHVRDTRGRYLLASVEQILEAAREAIDQKVIPPLLAVARSGAKRPSPTSWQA